MVNLYNNLAALCKERGLTPSGLCVKCGISKNVVARLKKNPSANLSYATASRFAQYLGVDVEEIQHGIKVRPTGNSELDRYLEMLRERPGLSRSSIYMSNVPSSFSHSWAGVEKFGNLTSRTK